MGRWRKAAAAVAAVVGVGLVGVGAFAGWEVATFEARLSFPDTPYPAIAASTDPAVIERGRYLAYGPAHCAQCHAATDRAHPEKTLTSPLAGGFLFDLGPLGSTSAANLTPDPETGIGALTDGEIARAVRTGVLHDGQFSLFMGFSAASPADEDLVAIVSFLRSTEPVHNPVPKVQFTAFGKLMLSMITFTPRSGESPVYVPASDEPSVERGEYLADHVMLCTACHSPYDSNYHPLPPKGGGGTCEPSHGAEADMEYCPPNLTSHPTGKTGRLTEDQFVARLHNGRVFADSIMPWESFGTATDADLRSVYRYIRTLPPVDHDTGPGYRPIGWTPEG